MYILKKTSKREYDGSYSYILAIHDSIEHLREKWNSHIDEMTEEYKNTTAKMDPKMGDGDTKVEWSRSGGGCYVSFVVEIELWKDEI